MNEYEDLALSLAEQSPCSKRKVGAVLVCKNDTGKVRLFKGVNSPAVVGSSCEDANGDTYPSVVHAEVRALTDFANSVHDYGGLTETDTFMLYVTHNPCDSCINARDEIELNLNINITIIVVEQFMKFDTDKLRYDLIPPSAMEGLAEVLTYGAKKYKPNNWKNGDMDRYIAALYRHLEAWRKGEKNDEESGMAHLKHAITNVAFLLELDNEE